MNTFDKKISLAEKQAKSLANIRKVFTTPEATHTRNQLYIDYISKLDELGLIDEWKEKSIFNEYNYNLVPDGSTFYITLDGPYINSSVEWEQISDYINEMGWGKSVVYKYEKKEVIDGVKFMVYKAFSTDLPDEYIDMLDVLGKVERRVDPASVSTTISCEIR